MAVRAGGSVRRGDGTRNLPTAVAWGGPIAESVKCGNHARPPCSGNPPNLSASPPGCSGALAGGAP
eukprot:1289633-Lingulodinium_polyedra.AAC.1